MSRALLRCLFLLSLASLGPAQGTSSIPGNERCQALTREGQILRADQKFDEALAKFREAAKADPGASMPLSQMAHLFYAVSVKTDSKQVEAYRNQAKALALEALARHADDPLALEVLRGLSGETRERVGSTSDAAKQAFEEAETLFEKGRYREALPKYLAAFDRDPRYAKAVLYAGDCHFAMNEFTEAETCYGKATELDPGDAQAWRFLADARAQLRRPMEQVKADLLKAIAAQPNYLPAWARYEEIRKLQGTPLKVFSPVLGAGLAKDPKTGSLAVQVGARKGEGTLDAPLWMAYGLGLAAAEADLPRDPPRRSPFETQRYAWERALAVGRDLAGDRRSIQDPTLLQFKAFAEARHLETGIFLFLYKESYRPDFEAWKRKNPRGIETFLEVFSLRPPVN